MAPKKPKLGDDEVANQLEELKAINQLLKRDIDDETYEAMTEEDVASEIKALGPIADTVASQADALSRTQALLAELLGKAPAQMKPKEGALVTIPDYKPVKQLTIRKLRGGSGRILILNNWNDRDGNPTVKGFLIEFPDDMKLCWDSEVHAGQIPASVVTFYGGLENVLGIIRAVIERKEKRAPGSYEIIDKERMDLILAEEDLETMAKNMVEYAVANPNHEKAKEILDSIKKFQQAIGKPTGPTVVSEGPSGR